MSFSSPRQKKQKVIVIVGQTASGKSALAVDIARAIEGEIISADSRQVYRDLDIGTGKITRRDMRGIPHHLLDIANPRKAFSAAQFKEKGREAIETIAKRNHVPIIAGGTGFYIDTLLFDDDLPPVSPDTGLRALLEKKTATELFARLSDSDPERAASIDKHNKRRLIRALEITETLGGVPKRATRRSSQYEILWIGIRLPDEVLRDRIHNRNADMIAKGLVAEVKRLKGSRISDVRICELGFEYRFALAYIKKEIDRDTMFERMNTKTWHYAKRQKTWFQRNTAISWFAPTDTVHIMATVWSFLAD
ncbi:MAG: tRNA (adenosine(37)-N6)-dimethylallyltransferase MiaA [Parcubacteria group bacterium]|nr:tRNA (adenosine(37)-N6)-dimethylallyltransferase MiaA [Parcubacteria group bacterium]